MDSLGLNDFGWYLYYYNIYIYLPMQFKSYLHLNVFFIKKKYLTKIQAMEWRFDYIFRYVPISVDFINLTTQ